MTNFKAYFTEKAGLTDSQFESISSLIQISKIDKGTVILQPS